MGGIGALSSTFFDVIISFGGDGVVSVDEIVSGSVITVLPFD